MQQTYCGALDYAVHTEEHTGQCMTSMDCILAVIWRGSKPLTTQVHHIHPYVFLEQFNTPVDLRFPHEPT